MIDDIPSYGDAALAARDIFFFQFNDVLIYVEDADRENFYQNVFKKLIPGIKVENFFPLSGKPNALKHFSENGSKLMRPSFYLLDLDYDDLLNKRIEDERVIYLQMYSIENYLVDEAAVIELIVSEHPVVKRWEIAPNLKLQQFVERSLEAMRPLIRSFFLNQKFVGGEKSCSIAIESFTSGGIPYILDRAKIDDYEETVFQALKSKGHFSTIKEMREHGDQFIADNSNSLLVRACGKHLLGLIRHWLAKNWGITGVTKDAMNYRLASGCNFEALKYVADSINKPLRYANA